MADLLAAARKPRQLDLEVLSEGGRPCRLDLDWEIHPIPVALTDVARPAERLVSTALGRPSLISLGAALRAAPVPG